MSQCIATLGLILGLGGSVAYLVHCCIQWADHSVERAVSEALGEDVRR